MAIIAERRGDAVRRNIAGEVVVAWALQGDAPTPAGKMTSSLPTVRYHVAGWFQFNAAHLFKASPYAGFIGYVGPRQ
jgi:hypothetical protein